MIMRATLHRKAFSNSDNAHLNDIQYPCPDSWSGVWSDFWCIIKKFTLYGKAPLGVWGFILLSNITFGQVTGGQYSFEYLRLSNSPHVSALGGINVANPDNDISLALQNPALMRPGMHNELEVNYNGYYAGIGVMNLQYGYNAEAINTSFLFGVQYLNYGSFTQTTAAGEEIGSFHASDYAVTFGASRTYLEHWRYGADLKWAHSFLSSASASAALMDVGINYYDTASLVDFGAVAKNMGVMVAKYSQTNPAEPIPFDLQLGISKRFKHLPLRLIATVHHLYEWDVRYNNPADVVSNTLISTTDTSADNKSHFADKLFRHFIFGAEITLGKRILITGSYNFLHRKELALETMPGLAGFAFGVGINLNKFQVHYGRDYYHIAGAYNEIGITMALNKLIGGGAWGEKHHWNKEYPDWE